MSRPRITLFQRRSSPQPEQSPSTASNAGGSRTAGYFQLRRTAGQKSSLEWQFGQEDGARFQLRSTANGPTAGLILDQPTGVQKQGRVPKQAPANQRPALEQWRRPSPPTEEQSASSFLPKALEGEIVEAAMQPAVGRLAASAAGTNSYRNGRAGATRSPLLDLFAGEEGTRRVLATRLALDEALDRWWTSSEHAPLSLLRDGLLLLEAGHDLDETQRSFLLRTALRTNRGMVTALRYQIDADRTAFLLKDALLDTKRPFDPTLINRLRQEDEQSAEWLDYLEHDLAYEATVASGKRSTLAAAALQAILHPSPTAPIRMPATLSTAAPPAASAVDSVAGVPLMPLRPHRSALFAAMPQTLMSRTLVPRPLNKMRHTTKAPDLLRPLSHRWSLRWLAWAALMLYLLLVYGQPRLGNADPMVMIPEGTYVVSDPASSDPITSGRFRSVSLAAYAIDRHEVTNVAYRRCWEQNICPIPSSFDSGLRPGYFANRSYDNFPVVNVDWNAANQYCRWVGKRLPTLEEWEVAASLAPATGLRYRYPWGDRFEARIVNSVLSDLNDTQAVGSYHPAGSTPSGIMDLAGNVAEWTSMPAASMIDGGVIKGGSYRDAPEQLRNDALIELPRDTSTPWLGFRCAVDE